MDELKRIREEKLKNIMKNVGVNKMETEVRVNDTNFKKEVIEQSRKNPIVIDFWATWCMPCNILSPVLEKLAKEYQGKFILAKVNVDEARTESQKYGIRSIPSVKMFKNGKVVDEFIGALPESDIRRWLDKNLM